MFSSRPSSPKSDSELLVKTHESFEPEMQWNWGAFPTVWKLHECTHTRTHRHTPVDALWMPSCTAEVSFANTLSETTPTLSQVCQTDSSPLDLQCISPSSSSHFRTIKRQDSFDMSEEVLIRGSVTVVRPQPRTQSLSLGSHATQGTSSSGERNCYIDQSTPTDLAGSHVSSWKTNGDSAQILESTLSQEDNACFHPANIIKDTDSLDKNGQTTSVEHFSTVADAQHPSSADDMNSVTDTTNTQKQLSKESEDSTVPCSDPASTTGTEPHQLGISLEESEQGSTRGAAVVEGGSGSEGCAKGWKDVGPGGTEAGESQANQTAIKAEERDTDATRMAAEELPNPYEKVEQQEKKKGEIFCPL